MIEKVQREVEDIFMRKKVRDPVKIEASFYIVQWKIKHNTSSFIQ